MTRRRGHRVVPVRVELAVAFALVLTSFGVVGPSHAQPRTASVPAGETTTSAPTPSTTFPDVDIVGSAGSGSAPQGAQVLHGLGWPPAGHER